MGCKKIGTYFDCYLLAGWGAGFLSPLKIRCERVNTAAGKGSQTHTLALQPVLTRPSIISYISVIDNKKR